MEKGSSGWSSAEQLDSMFGVPQPTILAFEPADHLNGLLGATSAENPVSPVVWPSDTEPGKAETAAVPPISPRPSVDYSDIFPREVWKDVTGSNKLPATNTNNSQRSDSTSTPQKEVVENSSLAPEKPPSPWPFEAGAPRSKAAPDSLDSILDDHNSSLERAFSILLREYSSSLKKKLAAATSTPVDPAVAAPAAPVPSKSSPRDIDEVLDVIRQLEDKNKELEDEVRILRADNETLRRAANPGQADASLSSKLKTMLGV